MAAPFIVQSGSRLMPSLLGGLMGGAGMAYGPKFFDGSAGSNSAAEQMSALVAGMNAARSGAGVTVVTGGDKAASITGSVGTAVVVAGTGYILIKLSGVSLASLLWITRSTYKKGVADLQAGIDAVGNRLHAVRVALLSKIDALSGKQDELTAKQASMHTDLSKMGTKVDGLTNNLGRVHKAVDCVADKIESVDEKMNGLSTDQKRVEKMLERSTRGVSLLCRVVSNTIENRTTSTEHARELRELADSDLTAPELRLSEGNNKDTSFHGLMAPGRSHLSRATNFVSSFGR